MEMVSEKTLALFWLRKAFHAGAAGAAQNIAITYRENGDLRTAVKWFRKSTDSGDGDALVQLGIHYYWGKGTRKNYWGKGTRKNHKAAVQCFRWQQRHDSYLNGV